MENYERECAEKELLLKLQETEDAVKDGKGWLNLNELTASAVSFCFRIIRRDIYNRLWLIR